ncbi:MAG TPA: EamA family transporter [Candidatus Acidoferrum sp.]|nr:EamA family transporter [Candidatus Acidoferrum sp.]
MKHAPDTEPSRSEARLGIILGVGAVVFWSFGASLVFLGAKETGTWPFVTIASLTGGGLQMIFRRMYHGELRSALSLPWRLWLIPLVCFVVYGLVWPLALVSSNSKQVFGVSLINYLWPVLTVLFSVWWVPGVKLTSRTVAALFLAFAGLVCANLKNIGVLLWPGGTDNSLGQLLPYGLALVAATTWGLYSAFLVRWRTWAKDYVTSPLGFILIGLVAGGVMTKTQLVPAKVTTFGVLMTVLYGAGPLAAGYLLWELALPKARVQTLSLVAAATPILSTLLLCCFLKTPPGAELVVAALLVSSGVVVSVRG